MAVAVDQNHGFKPLNRSQRCTPQFNLDCSIVDVRATHTNLAHSLKQVFQVATNFHRSFSTPCLLDTTNTNTDTHPRIEILGAGGPCAPTVRALVVEVAIAIASGVVPTPVSAGLGGAYLLNDQSGETIAVTKPIDEEPFALNNPKGFGGLMLGQPGIKRSIRVGETGIRELAAYLLDHGGFAGVPVTALVKISHVAFHVNEFAGVPNYKIASLQSFVPHDLDAGEVGSSAFSVASVHRIGILDIRILNLDRHSGNILVRKNATDHHELVPIDHGLCLPEWLDDPYFEWLHWPQASLPFSDFEMDYISNLDPYKDAELLRAQLPSLKDSSLRILILCTIFLKQAADFGLCLADIGAMMTREFRSNEENSSVLEILCAKAKQTINASSEAQGDDDNNSMEDDEDYEIFQFDDTEVEDMINGVEDLPWAKPPKPKPKPRRVSSARSLPRLHGPLLEENNKENYDKYDQDGDDENEEKFIITSSFEESKAAAGGLVKSMSFSVQNYNYEGGGICFGEMSEDEWETFLKSFEKLLPQVFKDTKCMHAKQRLGTSCKF